MLDTSDAAHPESKIFKRFKTLGIHSSGLGHVTQFHQRHRKHYVVVSVGKFFKTYNCSKLGICRTSDMHEFDIRCIAADAFHVYTACQNTVNIFKHNAHVIHVLEGHGHPVKLLLPFNDHLLSVDESSNLKVWHISSGEKYLDIQFTNSTFDISTMLHPSTYLNKILLGSKQGTLQLWNVLRGKQIAEFSHWTDSHITVLQQSTAVDVVCVGTQDGDLSLFNIRYDKIIMKFHQDYGSVTCVSFRADGAPYMVSGTTTGNICVWDLNEKCSVGVMKAHEASVAGLTFLPGQPLLLSNAGDNSIKMWAFDEADATGRLLRSRSGHASPPTKLQFHDDTSIVSASSDCTLRLFSTEHASKDKCMGKTLKTKSGAREKFHQKDKKLPAVAEFCMETARERQWDGLVALHYRHPVVSTWNIDCSRKGSHQLLHQRFKDGSNRDAGSGPKSKTPYATSVCMTICGNFCLIGYSTGHVDRYNVQSGIYRGSYVDQMLVDSARAHSSIVCAVSVDSLNQVAISVGSEKLMKFWNFDSKKLMSKLTLPACPAFMTMHRDSGLMAVVLQDFSVAIADVATQRVVRSFTSHAGKISDGCWSPSGKWYLTASDDCTVHVRDVPSSYLVDCLATDTAACAVAMSPNSSVLATAHMDDVGIFLWSNATLFQHVSLRPIPSPGVGCIVIETDPCGAILLTANRDDDRPEANGRFLTLSDVPTFRSSCLKSDVIRQRNKPKEPPKRPKAAPFFLPSLLSAEQTSDSTTVTAEISGSSSALLPLSKFAMRLLDCKESDQYDSLLLCMKQMSLSSFETEIRTMGPDFGGSIDLIVAFLKFVQYALSKRYECDLVQVYLGLFLKHHADLLSSADNVASILEDLLGLVQMQRQELSFLCNQNLCVINYVKSATIVLG